MLELPQPIDAVSQLQHALCGKKITNVLTYHSQNKLIWYNCEPKEYNRLLVGKTIERISNYKGIIHTKVQDAILLFSEGVELELHPRLEKSTSKQQLVIELDDASVLTATVQVYGGIWCYIENEIPNPFFGAGAPNL